MWVNCIDAVHVNTTWSVIIVVVDCFPTTVQQFPAPAFVSCRFEDVHVKTSGHEDTCRADDKHSHEDSAAGEEEDKGHSGIPIVSTSSFVTLYLFSTSNDSYRGMVYLTGVQL